MGILDGVPLIISNALGASVMKAATLKKYGAKVSDNRGGQTAGAATEHDARALILDYSDFTRAQSGGAILIQDRKAIVIAHGLTVTPERGDGFEQTGEGAWTVIDVSRDPASATFELQLRPGDPA